ncbi:chemotaxis protein CheD [Novosphingobium sp.]|uniref:chemotaxis protein CheD n=1 Tax=Novosphingobium sp. TaxID=1874826 RepID=UPI003D133A8B
MFHTRILSAPPDQRITVMQGQARVSADPRAEFSTVLGSCVALCLYDPKAKLGGMNHFLLAEPPRCDAGPHLDTTMIDDHFGTYLMELLVNHMLFCGGHKARLKARLYGGAQIIRQTWRIGAANADFARGFIAREGIELLASDLGGSGARRVDFRPASGQVRCRHVDDWFAPPCRPTIRPAISTGDVELF